MAAGSVLSRVEPLRYSFSLQARAWKSGVLSHSTTCLVLVFKVLVSTLEFESGDPQRTVNAPAQSQRVSEFRLRGSDLMSTLPEVHVGESPDFRELDCREAQLLQKSLLPRDYLHTPTFEISFRYRTFIDVGGDFLDYFYLDDRQLGLYLGDVVGKGLTAAMYATLCMGTLRMIHKTGEQPSAVLQAFNRRLRARPVANRFCVTEYAVFNPQTLELRLANAGLPLPLHISANGCRPLGEGGLPSGLFEHAEYEQHGVQLSSGDAVLFATDGLYEAFAPDGQEFGLDRLIELSTAPRYKTADQILDSIFDAVEHFTENSIRDDTMAMVLKVLHPSPLAACRTSIRRD